MAVERAVGVTVKGAVQKGGLRRQFKEVVKEVVKEGKVFTRSLISISML